MVVPSPYVAVLSDRGAWRFSLAGFIGRFPVAMLGLSAVLLILHVGQSYAVAGAVSAVIALAAAAMGPVNSRLTDRRGQSRILIILVPLNVLALVALIAAIVSGASVGELIVVGILVGATSPSVGSMVRARWAHQLGGRPSLRTAFAWEGIVDETTYVLGPPFATVLAVSVVPAAGLAMSAILIVVGGGMLAMLHASQPRPTPYHPAHGPAALRYPGVWVGVLVFTTMGVLFGSFEVSTVAVASEQGVPGATGILLAVFALGSLCAGVVLGLYQPRSPLPRQLIIATAAIAVIVLPLAAIHSLAVLGLVIFVAGLAVAPILVIVTSLTEGLVPLHRLTEGLSVQDSGIAIGFAIGTALGGVLIDSGGSVASLAMTTAAAIVTLLGVLIGTPALRRAWASRESEADTSGPSQAVASADVPLARE